MMNARFAALQTLERCRRDGAWSGRVLDRLSGSGELDRNEAALAANLSIGVLQNSAFLDYYIDLARGSGKIEPKLRDILRLGAYQLFFLDKIPAHAAVNETVSLCHACGLGRASGLVNALLRKLSAWRGCLPEIPGKGTAAYLSTRYTQELWLTERLIAQTDYAFCEAFFRACNESSMIDLQINTLKTSAEDFAQMLGKADKSFCSAPFPRNCFSVPGGRISEMPGFDDGLFYVQDRAAAMAVEIARPVAGMKVLDACAAPGGKSFAAAIRMDNRGEILSCDIHDKKLGLISEGAERLGITCLSALAQNARLFRDEWLGAFDLVIADVPCSGFGVMRKKPEIRHKAADEVKQLPSIQRAVLENVSRYVKPGGTLLYSTCTVLREENQEIVRAFLDGHPEFVPVDFSVDSRSSDMGCYTFWPHIDGTDGFFAAKLKRTER